MCVMGLWLPAHSTAGLDAPQNIFLAPNTHSITIEWDGVTGTDFYTVYWGTTANLAHEPVDVRGRERHTLSNLRPDTLYFFALSASTNFGQEGVRSATESVRTLPVPPSAPVNFWITDIESITETSVGLVWETPVSSDIDVYRIYYGTVSDQYDRQVEVDGAANNVTVDGLLPNTRYYFNIISIIETSDGLAEESGKAGELIIDTLPDNMPPDTPEQISGLLTNDREITISITAGNRRMADFSGVVIRYGQTPGMPDHSFDIGTQTRHVFTGLPIQTTWHFEAVAYDHAGNTSPPTEEISISVDNLESYTDQFEDFKSGCFIRSLGSLGSLGETDRKPAYDVNQNKNKIGISGGYYRPSESDFKDFYGRDNYPVFLFYERSLHRYFAIDFKAGYMRSTGKLRAESGAMTGLDATFTIVPTSASINFRFPLGSYVWGFAGVGPDYWYVRETSDLAEYDDISKWVGGYHGRAGIWLYNMDSRYSRWGMLFETQYSVVDRFGNNDLDLGGFLFLIGAFYSF
jgi:hypothetical protein